MTTDPKKPRRFVKQTFLRHALGLVRNPDIQIVRDLIYLAFGQVGAKLMGFLLFAYLARALAPRDYGALETMLAITGFAALVVDFGLGPAAVRHRAQAGAAEDRDAVINIVPTLRLGLALLCVPGALIAIFIATDDAATRMLGGLLALALLFQAWRQEWLLQSLEMMQMVALGQFLRLAILTGFAVLLIRSPADVVWFGIAEIVSFAVLAGFYLIIQSRAGFKLGFSLKRPIAGVLLKKAFPLGLNAAVWGLIQYVPTLLVGTIAGLEQAAFLAAAQRLATSLQSVSYIYHFNLFPALSRRYHQSVDALQKLSLASFRLVAWALIGPAVICAANARDIMGLIFGHHYLDGAPVLTILVFLIPVQFLSGHHRWALTAAGETKSVLTAGLAGAVISALGTLALAAPLGAVGGAIASLGAGLAIWLVSVWACNKHGLPLPILARIWLPATCAALAVLPALLSDSFLPLWASLLLSTTIYGVLALIVDRTQVYRDLRHLAYAKKAAH